MIIVWGLYHEQQNTLKCGELPKWIDFGVFLCHFGYFLALSATFFGQIWLIFLLHCGVLQIVECVTAEAFM